MDNGREVPLLCRVSSHGVLQSGLGGSLGNQDELEGQSELK